MNEAELAGALGAVVGRAWGRGDAPIVGLRRLSGGASRETWSFDALDGHGVAHPLILRRDPPGVPKEGMGLEARLFEAAAGAGVPVPRLVTASDDPADLESAYLVMERVEGETIPRKILRDDAWAGARPRLAAQCGEILARLHAVAPDAVEGLEAVDQLAHYREVLDEVDQPHPAFELAFRWLEAHRPPPSREAVVHGDFRHGNLLIGPEGVRAVLDWELGHRGDPMEDLGWLCVKAWRFGSPLPVGGFGTYDQLVEAYEATSGTTVDRATLRWWETLGTLKWGIMCILQATAHTSGAVRSVELAAIGRRVCENEWDVLALLPPPFGTVATSPPERGGEVATEAEAAPPSSLHDQPDAPGLVEAVREFLERDVMAATDGRVQFHTRVAVNALRTVERELTLGPALEAEHAAGLRRLGVASETALADAIRRGTLDHRLGDVTEVVQATVRAKLEVANPKYLQG